MHKKGTLLYCFSPPVMLVTFVIEITLALYTLWRYKMNTIARLAALMLLFLAIFQVSEYMLCGGLGFTGVDWIRFGYVSITVLPPLGLHMAVILAGKKRFNWLVLTSYISAAVFIYFFVFVTKSLNGKDCMPNYAVFHVDHKLTDFYGLYYYGWLIVSSALGLYWAQNSKYRRNLLGLVAGYGVFIIPSALVVILNPYTTQAIPSVMCGFAVLMAISLVVFVLPGAGVHRKVGVIHKESSKK